ncbi:MAG TPA: hypothetical protein DIU00_08960 [Phycisphaerales bacterium]|nr:hypothetical protein [Phycisphaerales bacterium]
MNMQKKIKQCLKAAPKPPAPDGLLDKLQKDIAFREVKAKQSVLRRWFSPSGGSISPRRVAAAAVIAIAVLLPLSYGATKLIKRFITISQLSSVKVDFPYEGASLSPDGKHFAGITWDDELVVIDNSTGEQRSLGGDYFGPVVWSADGSEIAVWSYSSNSNGKKVLAAVSLKTKQKRILMENPPWLEDWSSDGKLVLGVRGNRVLGTAKAVMIDIESKKETVLSEGWAFPRFSPNADKVSYFTKEANQSILNMRKIDGTSHVKYTNFPGEISQPLWSPDGSHIVFTGTQKGINRYYKDLWGLRVQGNRFVGKPFPVVPDVDQVEFYNWSQNGQLSYRTGFRLGGMFTLPVDLQTGKATGAPRQLVRRGSLGSHCWSPDGKRIAVRETDGLSFISASSGEKIQNILLPDIGGNSKYTGRGISWSPDGRWIAFSGWDREKRAGIFLTTVEGSDVRLLVPLEGGAGGAVTNFDPTWSPDSKTIAYGYKNNVYVAKVEDGRPQKITASPEKKESNEYVGRPVFAPDGRSVAYLTGQRKLGKQMERILTTTIDGKETTEIFQLKTENMTINIFDLSPDGRHIVFTPGNKEIWCAPTDGGEPFKIGDISNVGSNAWAWMPKWSPMGDAITFIVTCEEYQYWVMENFLPAE